MGVFAVVAIAAAAWMLSGFGFALLAVPLLTVLIGAKAAVVGVGLLSPMLSLQLVLRSRRDVDVRTVALVISASLLGMPIGLVVLSRADDRLLQAVIGLVVLIFVLALWRGLSFAHQGPGVELGAGFASGVFATSTGTTGPPLVIALHGRGLEPSAFRATLGGVFLIQGSLSVIAFALVGEIGRSSIQVLLVGLPAAVLGVLAGEWGFARIDRERFRHLVLGMLVVSALIALGGAAVG